MRRGQPGVACSYRGPLIFGDEMSTATQLLGKDWYLRLATKAEKAVPVLNEIAEKRIRDLDIEIATARKEKIDKKRQKSVKSVDISERFTVSDIAKLLKVSESAIYEWIDNGTIEAENHGPTGRIKRISRTALENYLRNR